MRRPRLGATVAAWVGTPFPYERLDQFGDAVINTTALRRAISLACLSIGAAGFLALRSPMGPTSTWQRAALQLSAAAAVPLAVLWWRGPWPSKARSLAFVWFADGSVAASLLLYADPLLAMAGVSLMTTIGIYVTLVHSARAIAVHIAVGLAVLTLLWARVLIESGDVSLASAFWLAISGGLAGIPVIVYGVWQPMRAASWSSLIDPLTGLMNRRGLEASVAVAIDLEPGDPTIVAVLDLDRFKAVNDSAGHQAGDVVLQRIGQRLLERLPPSVLCARTGGEEFAVVAVGGPSAAAALGDQLRAIVHVEVDEHPVTASVGIHLDVAPADRREALGWLARSLEGADHAMYEAKRAGGDRSQVHEVRSTR